jgi:hypothetical protein
MNERIKLLAEQAELKVESWMTNPPKPFQILGSTEQFEKFAELIVAKVLDEVSTRAYVSGDRAWSDDVDRPWIELEFGYGNLHDAQKGIFK